MTNEVSGASSDEMLRLCPYHGMTVFRIYGNRCRCKKCVQERTQERRHKVKSALIEYKGGKCEICGYAKNPSVLEFHHTNPKEKDFSISANMSKSFDTLKKEVDKCVLVCANCHRMLHQAERKQNEADNAIKNKENLSTFLQSASPSDIKRYRATHLSDYVSNGDIKKLVDDGLLGREICDRLGIGFSTYRRKMREMGINGNDITKKISQSLDKEVILKQFKEKGSILQLGKLYGVSDNAIRKHLKKMGLPYRTKELKLFIDNGGT